MMEARTLESLVSALVAAPVSPVIAQRAAADGGVPASPGVYAWWTTTADALPGVPVAPVAGLSEWLLYIGIAPKDLTSRQRLRSRVCGNHLGGNIGSSTFRYSLAALLWKEQSWHPRWSGSRPRLTVEDNRLLSEWQQRHLRVSWVVCAEPWLIEAAIIETLQPPMNVLDNQRHPFCVRMKQARAALKAEAKRAA